MEAAPTPARPSIAPQAAASAASLTNAPAATASTAIPPAAGAPAPGRSPSPSFQLDLFRRDDFVSQQRTDWCVPASIQMMANLAEGRATGTLPSQRTLDRRARALSSSRLVGAGSEPQGWAGVLDQLGYGPYEVIASPTLASAVTSAARALRLTHRPVGLLVWRGAHAWVMSGFTATADPALTDAFRVTGIRISDPWYPRRRGSFGPTHAPDSSIGIAALARNFLPWHRPLARYAELDGRFVLVLPVPGELGRSRSS